MTTRAAVKAAPADVPAFTGVRWRGMLASLLVVGAAYYLGARLGLGMSLVERNVTALWPPTGIALAAYLLLGRRMWPAVALAAFAVNLPISHGVLPAAVTAAGNTVAPLVAATLLHRVGFRRQLDRGRDAVAIVFLGALLSMLISATIGAGTLFVSGAIPSEHLLAAWAVWWTGDAMGVLTVAPFLLCLPLFWELRSWSWAEWVEEAAILVLVAGVCAWAAFHDRALLFVVLPVLGWASWRMQLRAAAPAALVASLIATWAATHHSGTSGPQPLFEQMLVLQAFNACVALTSFFLAALVSEQVRAADALVAAAAELEVRVQRRTAALSAVNHRLVQEIRERSAAEQQLSREETRARREHEIAETLQRSLLPSQLPEIPGVALAARYVPASGDVQVGGDWYDVVQLPDGLIGMAIGDVAGHGLEAAATMGQLRMALRAYALHDPSPVEVMRGVHQLAAQLPMPDMATLIYLVFEPDTRQVRFTNAGHPPALVIADGSSTFLVDGLAPPVGVAADGHYTEASSELPPGATVLLYTDGLVERRGESIQRGLDLLSRETAAHIGANLEELCDRVLTALVGQHPTADDIALVAMRLTPPSDGPLHLSIAAEPQMLVQLRRALRRWLREAGVSAQDENEVLVACGEACANVVQHAYEVAPGALELHASLVGQDLEVSVLDSGRWRPAAERGGGWGRSLMGAFMDSVDVRSGPDGTAVTMRRKVTIGSGA